MPDRTPWKHLRVLVLLLALSLNAAADPAPDARAYSLAIAPTGDAALDQAVQDASTLASLRETAPVGGFALIARARADADRLATVLGSFGYYAARIAITIAGRPLSDPGLADALDAMPKADIPVAVIPVAVAITPGTLFHLRRIALPPGLPKPATDALDLAPGQPARAADVLATGARMQTALRAAGYALAKVGSPGATLDPGAEALDISFPVDPGPRVDLGPITITGLERTNESYVRRRLLVHEGERYDPAQLDAARADLAATGVFSAVRLREADSVDAAGQLPLTVDVTERPLRTVALSGAYSTDQGVSLSASWMHHNLFGNAEQLTVSAAATGLGGSATRQPGYNLGATLVLPDWRRRDQSLTFSLLGVREYLQAYDRTAAIASTTLKRKLTREVTASIGVLAGQEHVLQEGSAHDYTLLQLPVGLTWDSSDSLFEPTRGFKAGATITPTASLGNGHGAGSGANMFVIGQASAAGYFDFSTEGRSVLALRGLVAGTQGAGLYDIPPDQRFYAGGCGTIRGYRFQSVGPKFPSGHPTGGTSLDVGTVEMRQRFGTDWGAVAFVDGGQVGTSGVPFTGNFRAGAGVGVRYYTSIGPIRVDVAVPLVHERKAETAELYIGIGQAF